MLHEWRVYQAVPGRLPALIQRFAEVTVPLWRQHGIRPLAFWTVAIGPDSRELHYLLAWDSLAERELRWDAFARDPAWLEARAHSERDGPLVATISNRMLSPVEGLVEM